MKSILSNRTCAGEGTEEQDRGSMERGNCGLRVPSVGAGGCEVAHLTPSVGNVAVEGRSSHGTWSSSRCQLSTLSTICGKAYAALPKMQWVVIILMLPESFGHANRRARGHHPQPRLSPFTGSVPTFELQRQCFGEASPPFSKRDLAHHMRPVKRSGRSS
jgi:hypothetical protein